MENEERLYRLEVAQEDMGKAVTRLESQVEKIVRALDHVFNETIRKPAETPAASGVMTSYAAETLKDLQ